MHSREIERRLRLPAPDEPGLLPVLLLPAASQAFGAVRPRPGRYAFPVSTGFRDFRLVLAVMALLAAMVTAITVGALRLDRLPNPFDPNGHFGARGVTIDYPKSWHVVAALNPFNDQGGETMLILSNVGVDGCSSDEVGTETYPPPVPSGDGFVFDGSDQNGAIYGMEDRIFACVMAKPLADGEVRLVLMSGYPQRIGIGPIEPFDGAAWWGPNRPANGGFNVPSRADGWTSTIDGMPAKLVVETTSIVPGAEEVRTWGIANPSGFSVWYVRATLRGPDLEALRAAADIIATSLQFDSHPPVLDEATRDGALARAIDDLDRETRSFRGSDFYGCFPRSPGARTTLIDDRLYESGPDGPLADPVPVTCTTTVEPTDVGMWHATLIVSWEAGDGYAAGRWGWELFFPADGGAGAGAQGQMDPPDALRWPGSVGELPAPLTEPLVIPIGSIVEVLPPGLDQSGPVIQAVWQSGDSAKIQDRIAYDARPGTRYHVIDGPIAVAGFEWYLVEWQHGTSFGAEFVWIPATDGVRPLLRIVDPTCPSASVAVSDLLALLPAERVLCFGDRQLTLTPTIASLVERNPGGEVDGTPAWLAKDPVWRLFGVGGPKGLDGSIAFAIDPSLGEAVPTDTWLTAHGHFDDSASATCVRTFPEGWGPILETPDIQRLRCRELFVITSVEPESAP